MLTNRQKAILLQVIKEDEEFMNSINPIGLEDLQTIQAELGEVEPLTPEQKARYDKWFSEWWEALAEWIPPEDYRKSEES